MKPALGRLLDLADIARGNERVTRLGRLLPFGLLMGMAFAFIPLTGGHPRTAPLIAAAAVMACIVAATLFTRWDSFDRRIRFIPALACLLVAALLRQAEGGGASAIGVLPLVPVLWAALYGTSGGLLVSVAGVAAMFIAPIVLVGAPRYTSSDWARATLWSLGALLIGVTVQRLVMTVRRQRQELERLALTDSLTDLPNHRAWKEGLERALASASRGDGRVALAMIDIDRLKWINDSHGHEAGSAAIKACADAWHTEVRANDILARFGGDEFGLILDDAAEDEAALVGERLRAATPNPITCSIGVALWTGHETARELFIRADRALYDAKRGGRDRVVVAAAPATSAPSAVDDRASVTALIRY
jgi:diguanylate cyclase (GGDEF)-like protein